MRPAASCRSRSIPTPRCSPAPEIKRVVQIGQAQVGEVLISLARERRPYVRHRRGAVPRHELRAERASCGRRRGRRSRSEFAAQRLMVLFAVPWPPQGIYAKKQINSHRGHEGAVLARLQCRDRAHRPDRRRVSGDDPGGRPAAGARDRPDQRLHDFGRHRLRQQGLGDDDLFLRRAGVDPEEHDVRQQGGVRPARQADPGCVAQGGGRSRSARLADVAGEERAGTSSNSPRTG